MKKGNLDLDGEETLKPISFLDCLISVMVKILDHRIIVSKFEFQSHYYIHFQIKTFGKSMNTFILTAMGYIVPLLVFYKVHLCIE